MQQEQTFSLEKVKDIIKNRKNVNYIIIGVSFLSGLLLLSIGQNYECYIASAIIQSVAGSLIILFSYCSVQSFEIDTYITVFIGYFLSFSMITIVPLDAALTTSLNNQLTVQSGIIDYSDSFKVYWIVMYWIIFFITNFIYQLQQFFHNNGFIGFKKKIKAAFRQFAMLIGIGIGVFIALSIICLYWLKIQGFDNVIVNYLFDDTYIYCHFFIAKLIGFIQQKPLRLFQLMIQDKTKLIYQLIKAVALVLSNAYGISILAFLFGYGLVQVPFYLWNISERDDNLKEQLCKTHQLFKEYQSTFWQFLDICLISRRIQVKIQNQPEFSQYLERLLIETSDPMNKSIGYRFNKNALYTPDKTITELSIKLKSNGIISEEVLASIRHELKIRQFQYERMIQKWKRVCNSVFKLITEESLNEIDRRYSQSQSFDSTQQNKSNSKKKQKDNTQVEIQPVKVKAKELHILYNIGFKALAIILALFSILVMFCEATLVFGSPNKALAFYQMIKNVTDVPGIITLMLVVLFYIIFCTYFSLGKLKIFGSFELFPYFTHRDILIQNVSQCLFLTFPLLYNVMLLFGIIDKSIGSDGQTIQSGFDKFYDPMKEIPFFGHYYIVIVCFLIVVIGVASTFKKTQNLIQKLSKDKIQMNTLVQEDLMLKGELYILQEWQRIKQKQEEVKEIEDSTESQIPSERQSLDSININSLQNDIQNNQNSSQISQDINQVEEKQKEPITKRISNFFKRFSTTSNENQSDVNSRDKSDSNSQQKDDSINSQESYKNNTVVQSSTINVQLGDEENSKNKQASLKEKLQSK